MAKGRTIRKIEKKEDNQPIWYCDACTLEEELIYHEVTSKNKKKMLISHLALGEAYGNCLNKGEVQAKALLNLIRKMKKSGFLNVVGNDNIEEIVTHIIKSDLRMSFTDTVHVATALKKKCVTFMTTDKADFEEIDKLKITELGKKFGVDDFSITIRDFKS